MAERVEKVPYRVVPAIYPTIGLSGLGGVKKELAQAAERSFRLTKIGKYLCKRSQEAEELLSLQVAASSLRGET